MRGNYTIREFGKKSKGGGKKKEMAFESNFRPKNNLKSKKKR